ncbi:MAG: hypothetical protein EU541_07640 [Promethearchaeota archaeon]|nr:MAG: hypothetical protein EU541_07640 [Candidatus Lokiarchaeota archaeon]
MLNKYDDLIMKGVILDCLGNLMLEKFGSDTWNACLIDAGFDKDARFFASQDVEDEDTLKLVGAVCNHLNITLEQAADVFGDYWVNNYAPKIYKIYYTLFKSSKDFLLQMDRVHLQMTKNMPNAHPPRFEYQWEDDNTLIMKYKSERNLIDFLVGLIKGVGNYFNEDLDVTKLDNMNVRVKFP